MKEEMNPSWLFLDKKEVWAKCKKCGEWNMIREKSDIRKFKPSADKPIIERSPKCGHEKGIVVDRVWFARKGMKRHRE